MAEGLFVRIAEQIIKLEIQSIKDVFSPHIFETEYKGEVIEQLSPMGLLKGIESLGIDNLTEKETKYLLRVLTKPELDGAIVVQELL